MADFMEEMLNSFFGKGSKGGKDPFDDFEDLVTMLEKGSEKETRKMFRELGRNARTGNRRKPNRGKPRGKKSKGGIGMTGMNMKNMSEQEMMAFMLGGMFADGMMGGGMMGGVMPDEDDLGEKEMEDQMAKEYLKLSVKERQEMLQSFPKEERVEFVKMISKYEDR